MSNPENQENIIKKISEKTGLSKSSVYKILSDPFEFSVKTGDTVRALAEEYGIDAVKDKKMSDDIIWIRVMIPCRPSYYWRKAAAGMRAAQRDVSLAEKKKIRLDFSYYSSPFEPDAVSEMYEKSAEEECDGYIVYPACRDLFDRFISDTVKSRPVEVFNEARKSGTDAPASSKQNLAYISADNYAEGRKAFSLVSGIPDIKHIVAVLTTDFEDCNAASERIRGFTDAAAESGSRAEISRISIEMCSKMTSAFLAGKLFESVGDLPVDVIYVSSGVTHIACEAVIKLRKSGNGPCGYGGFVKTMCVGHEVSPADEKYFESGMIKGCVAQDVYVQGYEAVKQMCGRIISGNIMKDKLFESKIIYATDISDGYRTKKP